MGNAILVEYDAELEVADEKDGGERIAEVLAEIEKNGFVVCMN